MNAIEPDEHLRTALRHAPDAEVVAPDHVSALILAAAHRSAAERPTAPARTRGWITGPVTGWLTDRRGRRWGASGALALLVMVGLIPLLWRGELPGPGSEPRETAEPALAVTASTQATTPPTLQQEPEPALRSPAPQTRPAPRPAAAKAVDEPVAAALPVPVPVPPPPKPARMQPESPSATESTAAARHEERTESARLRDAAGPVRALKREAPMAAPVMQSAAAPDAAQRVGAAALASRGDSSSAANAAIGDRPAPWRAVRTQGAVANWVAMESLRPPDADWLDRLEALAHSGWQSTLEATPAPGAPLLRWQLAGLSVGRLWLEDGAALWCGRALPCQRAPVQSQALRALLAELAR